MRRGTGWAVAALLVVSASGCGNDSVGASTKHPLTAGAVCAQPTGTAPPVLSVDLDGDGRPDALTYYPAKNGCPAFLAASIADAQLTAPLPGIRVTRRDLTVLRFQGRTGKVVLVKQQHPRGGFQATLFGYARGTFAALTADGRPLFPFIATDALTTPYSAHCTAQGFDIVRGSLRNATWTVQRTTYTVSGNVVTRDSSSELASGLTDEQLGRRYRDAATYDLFTGCAVG